MTIIYAFTYPEYKGLLKVGETIRSVHERLKANILMPEDPEIVLSMECGNISDHDVHRELKKIGIENVNGEWFRCTKEDVLRAILNSKGIPVIDIGCSDAELLKIVEEGQKLKEEFGSVLAFQEAIELFKYQVNNGIEDVSQLKEILKFWRSCNSLQDKRIIEAILKYGFKELTEKYEEISKELRELGNYEIKDIMSKKSTINNFLSLHEDYKEDIFTILEKTDKLENILRSYNLSHSSVKSLLKNFDYLQYESKRHNIPEEQLVEIIEAKIGIIKSIVQKSELVPDKFFRSDGAGTLFDINGISKPLEKVDAYIEECRYYLGNKEKTDDSIKMIKELWKQLGVDSKEDFLKLIKTAKKEREEQKADFLRKIIGDSESIDESFENRTFNFGKYKGEKIKEIIYADKGYTEWLCKQYIEGLQEIIILTEQVKKERKEKKEIEKEHKVRRGLKDVQEALGIYN